jgi:hypothetical protein
VHFATSFASVVDTGGKFATGVNETGGKFATGFVSKQNNETFMIEDFFHLPPVSTILVVHLELRICP